MVKLHPGPIAAGVAFTTLWIMAFDKTPIDSLKSSLEGAGARRIAWVVGRPSASAHATLPGFC